MSKEKVEIDESNQKEELEAKTERLFIENRSPYERKLKSDFEVEKQPDLKDKISPKLRTALKTLPKPNVKKVGAITPAWNSVVLFINLSGTKPPDYHPLSYQQAAAWLDEGSSPADPNISDFFCNYWYAVSYGSFSFGIDTPRRRHGEPLTPALQTQNDDPKDWGGLIKAYLNSYAEEVWNAAKRPMQNGKRWIPSVILVHNYQMTASAAFGGFDMNVGGIDYTIGDIAHLPFNLDFANDLPNVPVNNARQFWGVLAHEYGHNFLEFGDLYGPQGCVGYWDLLGDNSPPGRMSEISSPMKERVGWLTFKHVIKGPYFQRQDFSLRPYTTTGDCIKIIPDEQNNPHEFFTLEYRKSTGNELWIPDRALEQEGLLINHFNTRMGISPSWLLREAPYLDHEYADFSDFGTTKWTGHLNTNGALYPQNGNDRFTPSSRPNSNFYGKRPSGLSVTNIRIEDGLCKFSVGIGGEPRVGWQVGETDRCLAGNFTTEAKNYGGQEIFCRRDDSAALLTERQAQWLVVNKQTGTIGNWQLGHDDRETVGDFDGDGLDEIFIRSRQWAGILKWQYNSFGSVTVQTGRIGDWALGANDREIAGDFDGDGRDEILVRSDEWMGILKLHNNLLENTTIASRMVGSWQFSSYDVEYAGRFSQHSKDEILIRNRHDLCLLEFQTDRNRFAAKVIHYNRIGNWQLNPDDKLTIGDFDGDGLDEIYIRSARWAGVLKYDSGTFRLLWIQANELERADGDANLKIPLTANDKSYAGRFNYYRDGVLHRSNNDLAVLFWNGSKMEISKYHQHKKFIGGWHLGDGDKYVIGDFHRFGPDIGDPTRNYIVDGIADIFVHNSWGTAMFGINPGLNDNIESVWINPANLLFDN